MVGNANEAAKRDFSDRLNQVLDATEGAPHTPRGRPPWLIKLLQRKAGLKITAQAATKWLKGEAIPSQANLSLLCQALGTRVQFLMANEPPMFGTDMADEQFAQLVRYWGQMSPEGKAHVLRSATYEVSLKDSAPIFPVNQGEAKDSVRGKTYSRASRGKT